MSVEVSHNGKYFLTSSEDHTAKLWDLNSGKLIRTLAAHGGDVNSAEFSSNDLYVITSSSDGTAKIWDIASGKVLHSLSGGGGAISSARFSPDGKFAVTATEYGEFKLWKTISGLEQYSIQSASANWGWYSGRFSSNSKFIVTLLDSVARVWDIETGKLLHTLNGHSAEINDVQFSPDDKYIITGSSDSTARVWEWQSERVVTILEGHDNAVISGTFSKNGKYVATSSRDSTAKVWETSSWKLLHNLEGHGSVVYDVQFSFDNTYIATASDNVAARIWDTISGELLSFPDSLSTFFVDNVGTTGNEVYAARFSPNSLNLVTASNDHVIRVWDPKSGHLIYSLGDAGGGFDFATFIRGDEYFGISGETTKIWEVNSGRQIFEWSDGQSFFSQDHKALILDGYPNVDIIEFSPVYKRITMNLYNRKDSDDLNGVIQVSPNGKYIVTVKANSTEIRAIPSGRILRSLKGDNVTSAVFTHDSKFIVTGSTDKSAIVWEVNSGKQVLSLQGHTGGIGALIMSPDDKYILTCSEDRSVKLWEMSSGRLLHSFETYSDEPTAEFSFDGKQITTTLGEKIRIWDTLSGQVVKDLPIPAEYFSINSSRTNLISINSYRISLYDFSKGIELMSLYSNDSLGFMITVPSGLFDASPSSLEELYFVQNFDFIELNQLKERYYEPGLWKKVMSGEKLRDVSKFNTIELPPDLSHSEVSEANTTTLTATNRDGGIGQITILVNGLEAVEDIRPKDFDPKSRNWSFELRLSSLPNLKKGEENLVEIRAWNEGHWVISKPLAIRFTPPATRGAEVDVVASAKKPHPSIFILAVGVSDYEGDKIDLKYAAKDAEAMATSLSLGARKLFGTDSTFLYSLTDQSDLKPTKENIEKTFRTIATKSSPNDVFVVYLSGHGINWGGDNGDFYYLTKDAYSTSLEAYNDPAIRSNATLSSKELIELFKLVPSDKRVLIIDACASGKMVQNLMASRDIESSTLKALDRMRDRTGFHIITGCAADAVSYEASRFGQGVLTYSLIEGIKGASLKDQKSVDVNMLFQYARERVPTLAKGIGGIQTPQVFSPSGAQSFDIGILDEETKSRVPLPKTRPVYVRSTFINDDTLDDSEDLSGLLDEALGELSSKGEKAPLLFMDIQKFDDACKVSGKYKKEGKQLAITFKVKCGLVEKTHTLRAENKEKLVELIIQQVKQ